MSCHIPNHAGKVFLSVQNGKVHTAQVKDISKEDGSPLSSVDFKPGASLLVEHKGKFYPVEFVQFKGNLINLYGSKVI